MKTVKNFLLMLVLLLLLDHLPLISSSSIERRRDKRRSANQVDNEEGSSDTEALHVIPPVNPVTYTEDIAKKEFENKNEAFNYLKKHRYPDHLIIDLLLKNEIKIRKKGNQETSSQQSSGVLSPVEGFPRLKVRTGHQDEVDELGPSGARTARMRNFRDQCQVRRALRVNRLKQSRESKDQGYTSGNDKSIGKRSQSLKTAALKIGPIQKKNQEHLGSTLTAANNVEGQLRNIRKDIKKMDIEIERLSRNVERNEAPKLHGRANPEQKSSMSQNVPLASSTEK